MLAIVSLGLANTLVLSRVVILWENRMVRVFDMISTKTRWLTSIFEACSSNYDSRLGSKLCCTGTNDATHALGSYS